MKIKIPTNCNLEVTHIGVDKKEKYITVSNKDRTTYFLYKVGIDGKLEKVASAKSPSGFEEKFNLYE